MLRLWGRITSINVRKVVMTLNLLQVPFERVDAGLDHGVVQTPEYKARNPNALVPLLEEDDFTLWESNVIVRYLCAKHSPGDLYPEALRERADAERWMDWQQTTFNGVGRVAFRQLVRTPEAQRDPQAVATAQAKVEPLLAMLDAHLAQSRFLAGERLTMADIPLACEMDRWWRLPLAHREHPNLRRWYEGMRALPAAHGVLDLPLR